MNQPPTAPDRRLEILRRRFPAWVLSSRHPGMVAATAGAMLARAADRPEFPDMAAALFCDAWQRRPLDAQTVRGLGAALAAGGRLAPGETATLGPLMASPLFRALAHGPTTEDAAAFAALPVRDGRPEPESALEFALQAAASGGAERVLVRLGLAWETLAAWCEPAADAAIRDAFPAEAPPALAERLMVERAFQDGRDETALRLLESPELAPFQRHVAWTAARVLGRTGREPEAIERLASLWKAAPWDVNGALVLRRASGGRPDAPRVAGNRCAVLLYAFNKAGLIGRTLATLAASRLNGALVVLLDNGSSDETGAIMEDSVRLFPEGTCRVVRLPANIGAPGARNWLLSLPEVRARDYAAFLDDDALVPENWLEVLTCAAARRPGAGAAGCRIVDLARPHRLQTADVNLLPPGLGAPSLPGRGLRERLFVFDACPGHPDDGAHDYERSCLSVSGCCHLLNLRHLEAVGGFDIRFSPTQFDDLERDMRAFLAGHPAFYAGSLAVRHVRGGALAAAVTPAQTANVLGNKAKLEGVFSDEQAERLARENLELLWADFLEADRELRERFKGQGTPVG